MGPTPKTAEQPMQSTLDTPQVTKSSKKRLGGIALAVALGAAALSPVAGAADAKLACDPGFYQVISGQFASLDPNAGVYQTIGPDHSNFNAMGYRAADGLMYAIAGTNLQRIDANGVKTDMGALDMPGGSYTGDFGDDGLLHVSRGGRDWHTIDVDTMTATLIPELSQYTAVADMTNVHGKFYGVSSDGSLMMMDPAARTLTEVGMVSGLPESLKSYGAAWSTAGGNLYVGRNSGEIYQITGYTTSTPSATQVGTAPATNSNDGASCSYAAPPAGLDDVDGPTPESEPSTPESQAAADSYEENYDEISKGFVPAETQEPEPETEPEPATTETDSTYTVDDAGIGEGASCSPGADEDRLPREALLAMSEVSTPTGLYTTDFTGNGLNDFTIASGRWTEADSSLNQHHNCGYDYTVLLDKFMVENFRWESTFHGITNVNQGGVLFNQSSLNSRSGAMVVDLADGGSTLRWGSYDNAGYYQNMGSMPIAAPATGQNVTIAVEVYGTAVTIFYNGTEMTQVTAPHAGGMVGLIANLADVGFDTAVLTAMPAPATEAPATTEAPAEEAPATTEAPAEEAPATTEAPAEEAPATTEAPAEEAPATTEAPA